MIRYLLAFAVLSFSPGFLCAQPSLPSTFQAKTIHSPNGADIFVRWGGIGPVVVLVHGYAENSDSWAPLAADLMKDHTVVVPVPPGAGLLPPGLGVVPEPLLFLLLPPPQAMTMEKRVATRIPDRERPKLDAAILRAPGQNGRDAGDLNLHGLQF